jgi:hypothetical protein
MQQVKSQLTYPFNSRPARDLALSRPNGRNQRPTRPLTLGNIRPFVK